MAIARLGSRDGRRHADAFADLARRRARMAPTFCVSGRVHFHRSAVAYAGGNSNHPGPDAHRRPCRRGNSDAPWNSSPSRGQPHSREQRTRGRE